MLINVPAGLQNVHTERICKTLTDKIYQIVFPTMSTLGVSNVLDSYV